MEISHNHCVGFKKKADSYTNLRIKEFSDSYCLMSVVYYSIKEFWTFRSVYQLNASIFTIPLYSATYSYTLFYIRITFIRILRHQRHTCIHAFFYKNKLYKNTEAQIWPKIKNKLRTSPA